MAKGCDCILVDFEILALVQFTDKGSDVLGDFEILALVQFTDKGADVLAKWAFWQIVWEPGSTATSVPVRSQ